MNACCDKKDIECVHRYKGTCFARRVDRNKCLSWAADKAFGRLTPEEARAEKDKIRKALNDAAKHHIDLSMSNMEDIRALAMRCPHKNTQPMKGRVGPNDESTQCLDCGGVGSSPDNIGG